MAGPLAVVTVREQQNVQESILEGWPFDGGVTPARTRSLSWSGEYRVQGIASNQTSTYVAGRHALGVNAEQVDATTLERAGSVTNLAVYLGPNDAGVTRMKALSPPTAPIFVWVSGESSTSLYRMETQNFSTNDVGSPNPVMGDDVIDLPTPNTLLATARCTGSCTMLGITSVATGSVGRLIRAPYIANASTVSAPTDFSPITGAPGGVPVFDSASPIRVASDGSLFVYLAGQGPGGTLVVERRDATTNTRDVLYTSSGAIKLADMTRAQTGSGVYLLVTVSQLASFAGTIFNPVAANLGNVAVIRIDTIVNANFFDIPLDQQAVAFTKSQGFLYVAVQEGPNAVLWKIPAP